MNDVLFFIVHRNEHIEKFNVKNRVKDIFPFEFFYCNFIVKYRLLEGSILSDEMVPQWNYSSLI